MVDHGRRRRRGGLHVVELGTDVVRRGHGTERLHRRDEETNEILDQLVERIHDLAREGAAKIEEDLGPATTDEDQRVRDELIEEASTSASARTKRSTR